MGVYWRGVRGLCSHPFPRLYFSGIQPTGVLHLGNYYGAVLPWVQLQAQTQAPIFIAIADLHSLTSRIKRSRFPSVGGCGNDGDWRERWAKSLEEEVVEMGASLLACGLDPDRVVLFQQSRVPEHLQLAWLFNSFISVQKLRRLTQFKDKAKALGDTAGTPAGLLIYPVLQAADILLYKATHVPVGADQEQHFQLEVVRDIAKGANGLLSPTLFPIPEAVTSSVPRLKSLRSATAKMSKSDPDPLSRLLISDSPDEVHAKLRKALTDSIGEVSLDEERRPAVSNLIKLHSVVSGEGVGEVVAGAAGLTTAEYKPRVAEAVVARFAGTRAEYLRLLRDPQHVLQVLHQGSLRARETATLTMQQVQGLLDRN